MGVRTSWATLLTQYADNTTGDITAERLRNLVKSAQPHTAAAAPTVNSDSTAGFDVGHAWLDTTGPTLYECVSAAEGAAVWTIAVVVVATISALAARAGGAGTPVVVVRDPLRGGLFAWRAGDQSSNVTPDPDEGVWVPPTTDPTGESGAWERTREGTHVNVRWYGATLDAGQTPVARRDAIQAAIDHGAANGIPVFIPEGRWVVGTSSAVSGNETRHFALRYNTNSVIFGAGKHLTTVQLSDAAHWNANVFEPSALDGSVVDWSITDLELDGNWRRGSDAAGWEDNQPRGGVRPGSSCVATMGSRNGRIERLRAYDAVLHGIDICNAGEVDTDGTRTYTLAENHDGTYYPSYMSENIKCIDSDAEAFGDDGITVHYSRYFWVTRCTARDARLDSDINIKIGIEVDDGAMDGWVTDCHAIRCARGFAAKAHADEPSAARIRFIGCLAEECHTGIWFQHADGDPGLSNMGLTQVVGLTVRSPAEVGTCTLAFEGIAISTYPRVIFTNVLIDAGDTALTLTDPAIRISGGASDVTITGFHVYGWPEGNTSTAIGAIELSSYAIHNTHIADGFMLDTGRQAIRVGGSTADNRVSIRNVTGELTSAVTGSVGVRMTTGFVDRTRYECVGSIFIGYENQTTTVGTSAHNIADPTDILTQNVLTVGTVTDGYV